MVVGEDREDGRKKGGKTSGEFETEFKRNNCSTGLKKKLWRVKIKIVGMVDGLSSTHSFAIL